MGRNASGNYVIPPGTYGAENQTIESAKYNSFVDDVAGDLNTARPILHGGTAATSAPQALVNLGGERSAMLVTNFDQHLWTSGSFYSSNATGQAAPVDGHAFTGICYSSDPPATPPLNLNLVVEARDQSDTTVPGRVYIRQKKAGVWDVTGWKLEASDKVSNAGGVMTGPISIASDTPFLLLDKKLSGQNAYVAGALLSKNRWTMTLGDTAAESATDGVGSNFGLYRHNNAGTAIDAPFFINRQTGVVTINGQNIADKVNRAGDTMAGAFSVPAPTADAHASTKFYVDQGPRRVIIHTTQHRYLTAADSGAILGMAYNGASYFIVQRQANAPMIYGMQFDLVNWGTVDCQVYPADAQVSILSEDGRKKLRTTWSTATLIYVGGESWILSGSLIP